MNAHWREEKNMSEITIIATRATTAPQYARTAGILLEACKKGWTPEIEAEFQREKSQKEEVIE